MRAFSLASGPVTGEAASARPATDQPANQAANRITNQITTNERALLIALVSIYALVIGVLAFSGRFTFIYKTAIVPALIVTALLVRRLSAFVEDWAVFLASIIMFDALRGAVYTVTVRLGLPVHAAYVARADEALLGRPLSVILQGKLFQSGTIGPLEKFLTVVHGSHFLFFLLVGMAVWLFARDQFWRFRLAMVLLMALGITAYFAVPTVPPWMASDLHIIPPLRHITAEIYNLAVPTLQATLDTNPIAAMPSLHTAFPTLCSLIMLHHFGRRAWALPLYTLTVYFTIAYLGEHYLVDIAAGITLASFVYWVAYRWRGLPVPRAVTAPSTGRRWLRQAVIALVLIGASEAVGDASSSALRPLVLDPSFVQANMVGRSDEVHYTLGRYALNQHDYEGARRELRLALDELHDSAMRGRAATLLAQVPVTSAAVVAP